MVTASTPETHFLTTITGNSSYSLYGILLILLVVVLQLVTARSGAHDDRPNLPPFSSESKRRIQHGMTGCILVLISYCIPIYACIVLLTIATYLIYYLKTYHFHTIYLQNFGPLLRDYEKQPISPPSQSNNHHSDSAVSRAIPLPGAYYFLCGTTITAIVFPLGIARYSVLCLSLADPMAAYVGQLVPSYRLDQIRFFNLLLRFTGTTTNASVNGCIACFTTAWTIGYIQLVLLSDNTSAMSFVHPIITVTAGATACCIAEAISFFGSHGNDNLQIPIFTALVVTVSSWL